MSSGLGVLQEACGFGVEEGGREGGREGGDRVDRNCVGSDRKGVFVCLLIGC